MYSAAKVVAQREADERRAAELERDLARRWDVLTYQHRLGQRVFGPGCERRDDLAPIAAVWDRVFRASCGEARPVIALVSAPPQVGKTMLGQYACARHITRRPDHRIGFITYGDDLAREKSRGVRDIVLAAGVELRGDSSAADSWATKQGGGFLARGRDGGLTGQSALKVAWVCDPYKNRAEAESVTISRAIAEQLSGTVMTRRHPETSVVVEHTRWTTTDVIAHLSTLLEPLKRAGVDVLTVNLPCVDPDTGDPRITFGGRDRAYYDAQRALVSEHDWWALYMGAPRPREGKLFRGAFTYEHRPGRYAIAIGMDLAYSAKASADWSVALVLARDLDVPEGERPRYYVLDVRRRRCTVTEWVDELRALRLMYPSAGVYMRTGGQEAALLDTLRATHGLSVTHEPTRGDKLQNALPVSDEWRAGRVLVPASAAWDVSGFVGRVLDFSGQSASETDDEIDAMVTAYRALSQGGAAVTAGDVTRSAGRPAAARGGWL